MTDPAVDRRAKRRAQIEAAAYGLLMERGYAGTSMLAVARAAKASNETLYAWYGDKLGLFRAMVEANAAEAARLLESGTLRKGGLEGSLVEIGTILLRMILSDRAVSLNRVAAADLTGETGRILTENGRGRIEPLLDAMLRRHAVAAPPAALFLDMLVGDAQIRRVIGASGAPSGAACAERAVLATRHFLACARAAGGKVGDGAQGTFPGAPE